KIGIFASVILNTEISTAGDQKLWLARTLAELNSQVEWLTVNYHRPAWPANGRPSSAKTDWVNLFDQYAVDFAFEADDHSLKRTMPIRNGAFEEKGTIYLSGGGLGSKRREPQHTEAWYFKKPGYVRSQNHVFL